jgi:MarR family transcriptional regulator, organic hydroperoxide resistance regulator
MSLAWTAGSGLKSASVETIVPISSYVSAWRIASMWLTARQTFTVSPPPSVMSTRRTTIGPTDANRSRRVDLAYGVLVIEETLSYRLLKAMKTARANFWPVLADLGLHPGQELLLSQLWRQEGISQAELVSRLGVEPPTVCKALQRLERVGYVRRQAGKGRTQMVFLTDAGQALRDPVEGAWRRADEAVVAGQTAAERRTLADLLGRIVDG